MGPAQVGWFLFAPWITRAVAVFALLPALLYVGERVYARHGAAGYHPPRQALLLAVRVGALFAVVLTACYGLAGEVVTLFVLACVEALDGEPCPATLATMMHRFATKGRCYI